MTLDRDLIVQALPAYEIGDEIGRGGSGIVLGGVHRSLGREVAIKQLPRAFGADPDHRRRFVAEARLLASFDHPHIVPIFDYVEYEGVCVLVMERLTGGTVWDRMQRDAGVTPQEACAITLATCAALHYAHQQDTLHRDIKPENLMFSAAGTLKVTDFGIAKVMGAMTMAAPTQAGYVVGTPAYIAPEQAQSGELGPGTDVYALGTVLYELLAERLPYPEVTDQILFLYQHVHEDPKPLREVAPAVPEPIADAVDTALQRDPVARHRTAEDFGIALAGAATAVWGSGWLEATGMSVMGASRMLRSVATGRHQAVSPSRPPVPDAPSAGPSLAVPPAPDEPARATVITNRSGEAAGPPAAAGPRPSSPNRTRLVAALVVLALLIVGAVVLLTGGGDDDGGDATATTTTTAEGDGGGVAVPDTTLAGALALAVDDLPDGFEQRALGGVIDAAATDDPCLATLPAPYVFQAQGDAFGNDEPGLEVSSTVALTADADAGSANAEAFGGDGFLDCVRQAVQASVGEGPVTATLDRTALTGLTTYAGSWVIEARSDAGAAFVESVVLARGRAVVTVNFSSADGRVSEAFRDDVLSSVDARLRGTDQETGG